MASTQSAIDVIERLVRDHPENADYPIHLAGLCCNVGILLRQRAHIPESITAFDKAVALLDQQRAMRADTPQSTDFLGKSLNGRALSKEQALQWLSAAADHRRVLALVPPDEAPKIRLDVALCLAKAGRAEEAIAELSIVGDDSRLAKFDLFTRARIHAMLSNLVPKRKNEFADAAVDGLGKALRGGLSRPKSRLDDGDFKSLRDRDDFKKLVREFSEPNAKESKTPKK